MLELQERQRAPFVNDVSGVAASAVGDASRPVDGLVFRERLRRSVELEAELRRRLARSVLLAIPVFVAIWVGLIALALAMSSSGTGFGGPLAMGAAIGVLSGVFFGSWVAVVSLTETIDAVDHDPVGRCTPGLVPDPPLAPDGPTSVDERTESVR